MKTLVRTHLMLPKDVLEETDRVFGARKRSEIVTALLEESLRKERFRAAMKAVIDQAGRGAPQEPEEWLTSEGAAAWVRRERADWSKSNLEVMDDDLPS